MLQAGGDPDLLEESLRSERGGELGAQDLERDGPVVPEVVREVDHGHAAASELALDAIAIGQGGREGVGCFGQGRHRPQRDTPPAIRARSTDVQFATTISSPALSGSRKTKCVPSGITS